MGYTLPILSLALSLGAFYFSYFRHVDDLRVVFTDTVADIHSIDTGKDKTLRLYSKPQLIFINSGDRPVVISQLGLLVVQGAESADYDKRPGQCPISGTPGTSFFPFSGPAFVLEHGTTMPISLTFGPVLSFKGQGQLSRISDSEVTLPPTGYSVDHGYAGRICLAVDIAVADSANSLQRRTIWVDEFGADQSTDEDPFNTPKGVGKLAGLLGS